MKGHKTTHRDVRHRQASEKAFFDNKVRPARQTEVAGQHGGKGEAWLDILGVRWDLPGKDVLECACGTGRFTVILADKARSVTSFDISPESVDITRSRVARHGCQNVKVQVCAMERLPFMDQSFDIVVGLFILHHLADLGQGIAEISRVLKPGGKAVFYETCASNPILMFWRRHLAGRWMIPKLGSPDEHPLTRNDFAVISSAFDGAAEFCRPRFRFFGKLYFQLFRRFQWARPAFLRLDGFLGRAFPYLKQYSYQVMVVLKK